MAGNKHPRRRRHSGLERLKSLLIVLLTLSALALTLRVLLFNELAGQGPRGWLDNLTSLFRQEQTVSTGDPGGSIQSSAAAQPVRLSVSDGSERFAVQYDTAQTDQMFSSLGILLSEALSSAAAPSEVTEQAWRDALCAPGVWFDFLGDIPLEALCAWMVEGGSNPNLTAAARQVAVARDDGGGVSLYYHNVEDGLYYACRTAVAYEGHMDELVTGYGGNGASFVFELEEGGGYDGLDPYVLLSAATPSPAVFRASTPLSGTDTNAVSALQESLSFQVSSDAIYAIPGGLRLRLGRETLEIGGDGTVTYHTSEELPIRYPVGEDGYTVTELVETTRRLAADTVGRTCGAARLYLAGVETGGDGAVTVSFGYSLTARPFCCPRTAVPPASPCRTGRSPTIPCASGSTRRPRNTAFCSRSGRPPPPWTPCPPRDGSCSCAIRTTAATQSRPAGSPDRSAPWNGPS